MLKTEQIVPTLVSSRATKARNRDKKKKKREDENRNRIGGKRERACEESEEIWMMVN